VKKLIVSLTMIGLMPLSACSKTELKKPEVEETAVVTEDKTDENKVEETSTIDDSIAPGIYYDKAVYESKDEDGGVFYCIIIRDNNDVLIAMQDFAEGTLKGNVITSSQWVQDYTLEKREKGIYIKELDVEYTLCEDDSLPYSDFLEYYKTGALPDIMLESQPLHGFDGKYRNVDDHEVNVFDNGDGTYNVKVSIVRLTKLSGTGNMVDGAMEIVFRDEYGADISANFHETDGGSYELIITASNWDYLPSGETFSGFEYVMPEVRAVFIEDAGEIPDNCEKLVLDDSEYSVQIVLYADKDIKDFTFLSISLDSVDEMGDAYFTIKDKYPMELSMETPVVVQLTFPGDSPNFGFSYIDERGIEVDKTLTLSGRDGSLVVADF